MEIAKDTVNAGCKIPNKVCRVNAVEITRDIVLSQQRELLGKSAS